MKKEPTTINKDFIISFFLPDGMTDWFEIVGMREEPNGGTAQADVLYSSVLHIYLDERDNRIGDQLGLKPNGFTEATVIKDYPIRNRKVLLHVRRRRYLDADGRNIILNQYPLTADGTKLSVEFGLFLKMAMDSLPLTAASLARFFHIKGSEVERYYKHHLSDFGTWDQNDHATDWVLLPQNLGERCSIDETSFCNEVYTILSNKEGHGRKGSIIAIVRGTKADVVSSIIRQIPETERCRVTEITMDFSDSMYSIASRCFPNATIVIDCFHIVQRLCDGIEELRLKFKRLAMTKSRKEAAAFAKEEDRKAGNRNRWRRKHPKNPKEKRGRKRIRKRKYKPRVLGNGETEVEMLTRSRNMLAQSGDKWSESKRERAGILFGLYPDMGEAYSLICKVRNIFKKRISPKQAREELHAWYKEVNACTLREIKSARDCIKAKEEHVLNYFRNRSTNAAAESLNSKIKGFRAQLHGIADIPFFLYRVCTIFG